MSQRHELNGGMIHKHLVIKTRKEWLDDPQTSRRHEMKGWIVHKHVTKTWNEWGNDLQACHKDMKWTFGWSARTSQRYELNGWMIHEHVTKTWNERVAYPQACHKDEWVNDPQACHKDIKWMVRWSTSMSQRHELNGRMIHKHVTKTWNERVNYPPACHKDMKWMGEWSTSMS